MTNRESKNAPVLVWVDTGVHQCECEVPWETWQRIVAGEQESCWFETTRNDWAGEACFSFNATGYGSLYCWYGDDDGVLYFGSLNGAVILVDGEEGKWRELMRPTLPPLTQTSPNDSASTWRPRVPAGVI